ncbi:hypothetical protein DACRYDRAFT_76943 [Dacryopinax primogenitus]|uniref:Autophagy protein 5 n=1 Tax=Dacryopinax primogenitus (strain DJM 731) TaxID=1858805 RepID=M5GDE4_DACPD|nr:uncharacterized protein DACRYDRAFT_76943 [Dacryopinax primogenitus]EJU04467.1 hypothetical protein DACRYDRAFT_76943 [Dacryopinax primogenitus]
MSSLFRQMVWDGTVPLAIKLAPSSLPSSSDRMLDTYFIQAPRISYLPLLIPEIRQNLCDLVLDEATAAALREEDWWFETEKDNVLKWHWPIGLLYDAHFTTMSASESCFLPSASSLSPPMPITLYLSNPPADKLLLTPSVESLKSSFMSQCKEADFLRWGSTRRMTGLRKTEQDGLWDAIREHNYDNFWKIGSKILPNPNPPSPLLNSSPPTPNPDGTGAATTTNDAYAVRSIPLRLFLPNAPVIQDLCSPVTQNGVHTTLGDLLSASFPLLFSKGANIQNTSISGAYAVVQGMEPPLETEVGWLGASLAGADGWVNVCVGLRA